MEEKKIFRMIMVINKWLNAYLHYLKDGPVKYVCFCFGALCARVCVYKSIKTLIILIEF